MTDNQIQKLADSIAYMLLSHATHGVATQSLYGIGEITLRDGLVVAAAAAGAKSNRAYVLSREETPEEWKDGAVDLTLWRQGNSDWLYLTGGIELKWWRRADGSNASNRRRDLVKDFIRAASLYQQVESFSLVALLATEESWKNTTVTKGSDADPMGFVRARGACNWNITDLSDSSCIRAALRSLNNKIHVPNYLYSSLLSSYRVNDYHRGAVLAKVWGVKKRKRTRILSPEEIGKMLQ